jgi:signal transduction histidine kinase
MDDIEQGEIMTTADVSQRQRTRRFYPGVNVRIIGPFLLAIVVIAGIGVYIVTQLVSGSIQERLNNQLLDSASAATNTIVDTERQLLSTLRLMVYTEGVAEAISEADTANLDLWLRPVAANVEMDEWLIFNAAAQPLLYLRRGENLAYNPVELPDLSTWQGIRGVLGEEVDPLGDKYVDIIENDAGTLFFVSGPVYNSDDLLVGGVTVGIRAETLVRRVSEQSLSAVTLYTSAGEVLGTTFRGDLEALRLEADVAAGLMEEAEDSTPVRPLTLEARPYQVLYAPFRLRSESVGLLAVGLPSNFVVERSSTSRNVLGLLFSALFMTVAILGFVVARTITRPIDRLVSTTRAIREGDLSRRVMLKTPDELGELAVSFDHMTDNLVRRNEEINTLYIQQVEETARRDAVLSSINDPVIVQDLRGKIILFNRTAEDLIEALSEDREQRSEFTRLLRQPERLAAAQVVNLSEQHFSVTATPVTMASGEILGYVIVFHNITAIIQSEKLKDELMLQLSHELRTPLSAARGYVDLVHMFEGSRMNAQSAGFVERATDSLTTLERLINQSIDVSEMISNRFRVETETCNVAYLVGDAYQRWKPALDARELRFLLTLPSQNLWIRADPVRLSQLLDHLIRNAYSYTLPGGLVELFAEDHADHVRISVIDSGVGIDADEIDKVFERMYRGRSADAGPTDARGLGLGLYLSRQIVEAHRGQITLESKPDFGTIVTVELPNRAGSMAN